MIDDAANEEAHVDALVPRMGEYPITSSVYYGQLFLTEANDGSDEALSPLDHALEPLVDANRPTANRPALGVFLTFEQGWYQQGLALGELRHSLSLAPGEVTKIAVTDWRKASRAAASVELTEAQTVAATSEVLGTIQSVQTAVAAEARSGTTSASSSAAQVNTASSFSLPIFATQTSGAMGGGSGFTARSQMGSRSLAATAVDEIQRTTEQRTSAIRSARSTQIRELTDEETSTATTRVVANYNHMHSLNVQYFEVLQVYRLRTKVVQADRCVFLPMRVSDFTYARLQDPIQTAGLRRVATELGWQDLLVRLDEFQEIDRNVLQPEFREWLDINESSEREIMNYRAEIERYERDRAAGLEPAAPATAEGSEAERAEQMAQLREEMTDAEIYNAIIQQLRDSIAKEQGSIRGWINYMEINARKRPAVAAFLGFLNEHRLFLHQQLWMRVDEHVWHGLILGRSFPDPPYEGDEFGGLVDPTPLGYFGNYVAFRWNFPATTEGAKRAQAFEDQYTIRTTASSTVTVPSEGVFAEAVLGESNCAEELDVTRFWNWQDSPIPILPPEIAPLEARLSREVVPLPQVPFSQVSLSEVAAGLQAQQLVPAEVDTDAIIAALQHSLLGGGDGSGAAEILVASGANVAAGSISAGEQTTEAMRNSQEFLVGLANSEVAKIAANALAFKSGGISSLGGLLNAAIGSGGGSGGSTATDGRSSSTTSDDAE